MWPSIPHPTLCILHTVAPPPLHVMPASLSHCCLTSRCHCVSAPRDVPRRRRRLLLLLLTMVMMMIMIMIMVMVMVMLLIVMLLMMMIYMQNGRFSWCFWAAIGSTLLVVLASLPLDDPGVLRCGSCASCCATDTDSNDEEEGGQVVKRKCDDGGAQQQQQAKVVAP